MAVCAAKPNADHRPRPAEPMACSMACWRGVCRRWLSLALPPSDVTQVELQSMAVVDTVGDGVVLPDVILRTDACSTPSKRGTVSPSALSVSSTRTEHCEWDRSVRALVRRGDSTLLDHYDMDANDLGLGSFSVVRIASSNITGDRRAIKIIAKDLKDAPDFHNEINLLASVDHENIVRLFETFEDAHRHYLVLELCTGGELFDRIVEVGELTESLAALLMRQMANTICYLHSEGIAHRDLKPENFVFSHKGPLFLTPLKLIDFGLSCRVEPGEVLTDAVGTLLYAAPEVLAQSYGPMCDLWSFGAIVYNVLCGHPPFNGKTAKQVVKNIRKGKYSMCGPYWETISDEGKDLVRGLLTKDPAERLTGPKVLEHPWIATMAESSGGQPLHPGVINSLQELGEENRKAKCVQRRYMAEQLGVEFV
mmetsp:Transcript_114913/g.329981  ORF Transcript_114913/g.329981 Transcript_114913/m.329981 type:complete len:423 (-) Transcript_114913:239-1507(-)